MIARASKSLTVCLKCGNSGHDMFSCRNDYSPDDLKVVLIFFLYITNLLKVLLVEFALE